MLANRQGGGADGRAETSSAWTNLASGSPPSVIEQLGDVIRDINKKGVSVLLVEQNVHLALDVASRSHALQVGRVVLEGDIETVRSSDIVRKAYLGG